MQADAYCEYVAHVALSLAHNAIGGCMLLTLFVKGQLSVMFDKTDAHNAASPHMVHALT